MYACCNGVSGARNWAAAKKGVSRVSSSKRMFIWIKFGLFGWLKYPINAAELALPALFREFFSSFRGRLGRRGGAKRKPEASAIHKISWPPVVIMENYFLKFSLYSLSASSIMVSALALSPNSFTWTLLFSSVLYSSKKWRNSSKKCGGISSMLL